MNDPDMLRDHKGERLRRRIGSPRQLPLISKLFLPPPSPATLFSSVTVGFSQVETPWGMGIMPSLPLLAWTVTDTYPDASSKEGSTLFSKIRKGVSIVFGLLVVWLLSGFVIGNHWSLLGLIANQFGGVTAYIVLVVAGWIVVLSFLWDWIRGLFSTDDEAAKEALREAEERIQRSPHR